MKFNSGDIVRTIDPRCTGKNLKVLEDKGEFLLLEDNQGEVYNVFKQDCHKQMLFGWAGGAGEGACLSPRTEGATRIFSQSPYRALAPGLFIRVLSLV